MNLGVRSVTMSDLAKGVGISKKTLYQHFENKADLVHQTVQLHLKQEKEFISGIIEDEKNAILEIVEIGRFVSTMIRKTNPTIVLDMQKFYPQSWQLLDAHKQFIGFVILRNLEKGKQQGLYRMAILSPIIARLYVSKLDRIIDSSLFPSHEFQTADVYIESLKYHIHGVATPKGIDFFNQYLENLSNQK